MKDSWLLSITLAAILDLHALAAPVISGPLTMDNEALTLTGPLSGRLMLRSGAVLPVSQTRPEGLVKEPVYLGTPYYGIVQVGNGPRAATVFVMDYAPNERREDNRLYIDRNQNGDLTDDGDGVMQSVGKSLPGARVGPHFDVVPASWGIGDQEVSSADYGLMFLFGADRLGDGLSMITRTAGVRTGKIIIHGQSTAIALVESGGSGNFDIATAVSVTPGNFSDRTARNMTLLVDVDRNGSFSAAEVFDARLPFKVDHTTYEARASVDGARVTFYPTENPAQVVKAPVRVASPKDHGLLPPKTLAPDFTAIDRDGREVKLSEFRGKTVVLDFWATWCIPCIRSMPHVQKTIASATDGAEIVWIGVCVWDDLAPFKRWVSVNDTKYNFTKVFDPAGKNRATSIASQLYKVSGIPTIYVIDREGRIVEGLTGYTGDDDERLTLALVKAGTIRLP
jgi:thiol-disulfide isomerase/thioredoxin